MKGNSISPERSNEPVMVKAGGRDDGAVTAIETGGRLIWSFTNIGEIIDVIDPHTGDTLKVVTVKDSKQFSEEALDFPELKVIPSALGLVILPKVDDLRVIKTKRGVEVYRSGGLIISDEEIIKTAKRNRKKLRDIMKAHAGEDDHSTGKSNRLFQFDIWLLGNVDSLSENHNLVLAALKDTDKDFHHEGFLNLARMYIANAQGVEALGFLTLVEEALPSMANHPEYAALVGVAQALSWRNEEAFSTLSVDKIKDHDEVRYWRSYALADLGDWQQARDILPQNFDPIYDYPPALSIRLALVLTEVALRSGDLLLGGELFHVAEKNESLMTKQQKAALNYLRGEYARQNGEIEDAEHYWSELSLGQDDLYRVKAGLSLTRLQIEKGKMPPEEAINTLERLRYAWRGDDLEALVNYWLGRTYFGIGSYVKGLNVMRDAASYATGLQLGTDITSEMSKAFTELFLTDHLNKVPPPIAAALYEKFAELVPTGETGTLMAQNLAEHLVKADMLTRADDLFDYQLKYKLKGLRAFNVATRLTAIRLLDGRVDEALESLDKASEILKTLPLEEQTQDRNIELTMLRARTYSEQGRADQSLALLDGLGKIVEVNRLRADIAWNANYWDDAAEAITDVLIDEQISLTRPLSEDHANLILQNSVALNLANDRIRLANIRERYSVAMNQTEQARLFEVITRPRQNAVLADRETLMSIINEVDLFSDFLESYK